jgi:hypothetical protein
VALGLAYLTAGVLTVRTAVRYDPALAAGLAVFGLYCLFDARCRKR